LQEGKIMFIKKSKYFFILIITSFACAMPNLGLPDSNAISTTAAETVLAEVTQNLPTQPPTIEPTAIFTSTPTLIPLNRPNTQTPSATVIFTLDATTITPTSLASSPTVIDASVTITVSKPTNCRVGPGKAYEIAGTLLEGEEATVLGRDPSNKYWYIPNPDPGIEYCWVWSEYASFTGSTLSVPMFTPIATPTATGTALPSMRFEVQGRGFDKCKDQWWLNLEITNYSDVTFRSVSVEMTDLDSNTSKFSSSDGFIRREGCSNYFQAETIEPKKGFVFSGPVFPYNINGKSMRVFITVCTEKDQKGICNTIKIGAKP
jgi:hypothetical protein